ncbi:MAG: GNAT family N-acetyltransferase [Planctomycetaceae bacterium]|nr:GNAT family N-acetyltransferase [Planctomycetaceae bacterium]
MQLDKPICGFGLCLRQMTAADLDRKVRWFNDPQINRTLILDEPLELAKSIQWFRRVQDSPARLDLVIEADASEPIGLISLIDISARHRTAEIFIVIGSKDYWGKGVMLQAESLLIEWAFSRLGLEKIRAQARPDNVASLVTMKKLGFHIEGTLRKDKIVAGSRIDIVHLGLLREEFKAARG